MTRRRHRVSQVLKDFPLDRWERRPIDGAFVSGPLVVKDDALYYGTDSVVARCAYIREYYNQLCDLRDDALVDKAISYMRGGE